MRTVTKWYVNGELAHVGEDFEFPQGRTGEALDVRCLKTVFNDQAQVLMAEKTIKHKRVKDRSRRGKAERWHG